FFAKELRFHGVEAGNSVQPFGLAIALGIRSFLRSRGVTVAEEGADAVPTRPAVDVLKVVFNGERSGHLRRVIGTRRKKFVEDPLPGPDMELRCLGYDAVHIEKECREVFQDDGRGSRGRPQLPPPVTAFVTAGGWSTGPGSIRN